MQDVNVGSTPDKLASDVRWYCARAHAQDNTTTSTRGLQQRRRWLRLRQLSSSSSSGRSRGRGTVGETGWERVPHNVCIRTVDTAGGLEGTPRVVGSDRRWDSPHWKGGSCLGFIHLSSLTPRITLLGQQFVEINEVIETLPPPH